MDKKREKAFKIGKALKFYLRQNEETQKELEPLLSPGIHTLIELLKLLEEGNTYKGISEELFLHINTVKLYIKGLEDSGILTQTKKIQIHNTGSPRNFKRLLKSKK